MSESVGLVIAVVLLVALVAAVGYAGYWLMRADAGTEQFLARGFAVMAIGVITVWVGASFLTIALVIGALAGLIAKIR